MWIFDINTYLVLEVNESACVRYGYSRSEFLGMNVLRLRPETEHADFFAYMRSDRAVISKGRSFLHQDKAGNKFHVKPYAYDAVFHNRKCLVVQILDVDDYHSERQKTKKLNELLQAKLDLLKAIAWNQSHRMRSKIANLHGIVTLYKSGLMKPEEYDGIADIIENEVVAANAIIHETVKEISAALETTNNAR
jgi:PAS domain S-box-containing protein